MIPISTPSLKIRSIDRSRTLSKGIMEYMAAPYIVHCKPSVDPKTDRLILWTIKGTIFIIGIWHFIEYLSIRTLHIGSTAREGSRYQRIVPSDKWKKLPCSKGSFPDNNSKVNKCRAQSLTTIWRGKDEILYGSWILQTKTAKNLKNETYCNQKCK